MTPTRPVTNPEAAASVSEIPASLLGSGRSRARPTPNQDGRAEAVNILTALPESGYWLRRLLLFPAFNFGSPPRLRSFAFLNFAHVAAMRHFPYMGPPQPREELRFRYAIYCGDFVDGISEYVERFADSIPWQMDLLFSGSPGMFKVSPHADAWVQNILAHSFPSLYYYSAYPGATVNDVRNALVLASELRDFIAYTLGTEASDFALAYEPFSQRAARLLGRVSNVQAPAGHAGSAGRGALERRGRRPEAPRWLRQARRSLRTVVDRLRTSMIGDRVGRHRLFTFVLPVLASHEDALQVSLRSLPPQAFQALTTVHFARFGLISPEVVDKALRGRPAEVMDRLLLPSDARQLEPVGLQSSYVLFAVDTDSDFNALVDELSIEMSSLDAVLEHCVRYPGLHDRKQMRSWLTKCRVRSYFGYAESADHSVAEIQHAIVVQRAVADFAVDVARHSPASDDELQARFISLVDRVSDSTATTGIQS